MSSKGSTGTTGVLPLNYVNGLMCLAVIGCLLYLLWFGMTSAGASAEVSGRVIGSLGVLLVLGSMCAGLCGATMISLGQPELATLFAQYDLSVGRLLRSVLVRRDAGITQLSYCLLVQAALCQGRLLDAEAILRESEVSHGGVGLAALEKQLMFHIYAWTGRKKEALELAEDTLQLARKELAARVSESLYEESLAETYSNVGCLMCGAMDEKERGMELMKESLQIRTKLFGEDSEQVAKTLNNIGVPLHQLGQSDEAEASLRRALSIMRKKGKENSACAGYIMDSLATVLVDQGKAEDAFEYSRLSLKLGHLDRHEGALRNYTMARCLHGLKRDKEALKYCHKALKGWASMQGFKHPLLDECSAMHDRLSALCERS